MTMTLSPTRERFLQAIAREISPDQIAEIHFFQPMKQGGVESGVAVVAELAPSTPENRHTVYTARYRLVLKGPDRGQWEASVFAEADAPLVTVDAVVRGVQRRAGDVDAPDRLTGEEIRALLAAIPAVPRMPPIATAP
jgi:hypothetical protein